MSTSAILRNGVEIPRVGFGTWRLVGEPCYNSVLAALNCGYKHIDTASGYNNEVLVQKAREQYRRCCSANESEHIFMTSKASPEFLNGFEETYRCGLMTLENLQVTSVDLYLLHWPGSMYHKNPQKVRQNRIECWRALEKLYEEGKAKAIGVSNYLVEHLDGLIEDGAKIVPFVNQLEIHPLCIPRSVIDWAEKHEMILEAYSPLGSGSPLLLENAIVVDIAKEVHRTPAQVLLRWGLQKQFVVLPRSKTPDRIKQNLNVVDFELSNDHMEKLDSLNPNAQQHFCWDPTSIS